MLSVFGKGESMISIASAPMIKDYKQFSIMRTGRVTTALHDLKVGDIIGVRGPYGNRFPLEDWKGRDLVFIGGGVGLAPIWPVIQTAAGESQRLSARLRSSTADAPRSDLMYYADFEKMRDIADGEPLGR